MERAGRTAIVATGLALLCTVPLVYQIGAPFVTVADNNTAAFAQPARNFLRLGLRSTRLALVTDMDGAAPPFTYNNHHPPLASLAAAAVLGIAGDREWAARLYPALCTLGSALVVFLLWRRARGDLPAALATAVMATIPAFGHYGKMLGEEAPTLFWSLLALLLYRRWKDAPADRSTPWLAACLAAYALGCLSGWPGFYVGPLLMLDALATLRGRPEARRAALAGVGATGLLVFAAATGQLAIESGGVGEIAHVARERLEAGGSPGPGIPETAAWTGAVVRHFLRLYGAPVLVPAGLGLLAALLALARRRARAEGMSLALILAALGAAHPIVFRSSAVAHEWMLFHLMPILAIGAAEGSILLARAAGRGGAAMGATPHDVRVFTALGAALPLALAAAGGIRGSAELYASAPGYAWPILGREIARNAPAGSTILSSFPFDYLRSSPLRFYADRKTIVTTSRDAFEVRLARESPSLFVRDLDAPLDPELEARLGQFPARDVGMFRLHDLRSAERAEPAAASSDPDRVPLDEEFPRGLRLTGYAVAPPGTPAPVGAAERFFGLGPGCVNASRLVRVTSWWKSDGPVPPWKMMAGLLGGTGPRSWVGLPSLLLPEMRELTLGIWGDRREFRIESAFFLEPGSPPGAYEVRFAIFDGGNGVPLVKADASGGLREIAVAGKVLLEF